MPMTNCSRIPPRSDHMDDPARALAHLACPIGLLKALRCALPICALDIGYRVSESKQSADAQIESHVHDRPRSRIVILYHLPEFAFRQTENGLVDVVLKHRHGFFSRDPTVIEISADTDCGFSRCVFVGLKTKAFVEDELFLNPTRVHLMPTTFPQS